MMLAGASKHQPQSVIHNVIVVFYCLYFVLRTDLWADEPIREDGCATLGAF